MSNETQINSGLGVTIAISNQKGGEGKTTIATYLSEALSRDRRVLLIDWDAQANASRLVLAEEAEYGIYDCLPYRGNSTIPIQKAIQKITNTFSIIPSSISLANFNTPFGIEDFLLLKEVIFPIKVDYDYIIIDCPPSLGLGLENALIASDYVLVPVQTRYFSVQGLKDLSETILKIKRKANEKLELLGAVLNQFEESRALSGLSVGIKKYFPVINTIIPRRESIPQSQAKRKGLSGCDSVAKQSFFQLADEIKEIAHA